MKTLGVARATETQANHHGWFEQDFVQSEEIRYTKSVRPSTNLKLK